MKRKKKLIISIICGVILLLAVGAAIIYHYLTLPQGEVIEALKNTLVTTQESDIDKKYGGYDFLSGILSGNFDAEVTYNDYDAGVLRNKEEHKFLIYGNTKNLDGRLYVDENTSIVKYGDKGIVVDYADNLEEAISSSPIAMLALTGIDAKTIATAAHVYVSLMQALSSTATKDNEFDKIYKLTKDYILNLDGEKQDKKNFKINGKNQKCQVYKITFNAEELAKYVENCYNVAFENGQAINQVTQKVTGYTMEEIFDSFKKETETFKDLDIYFAVNKDDQLVSMYCENVSDSKVDFELNFLGGKYLCDKVEIKLTNKDGDKFTFVKDDVSEGDNLATDYEYSYQAEGKEPISGKLFYEFEKDVLNVTLHTDKIDKEYNFNIDSFEKGKYVNLSFNDITLYIGTKTNDIVKPEGDYLNIIDTDMVTLYSYVKDFLGEIKKTSSGNNQ